MNTIEKAEARQMEINLATAWYEDRYTQKQAQMSAELQSINWQNVVNEYARLYEIDAANAGISEQQQWN